jgi:hypothetical protein
MTTQGVGVADVDIVVPTIGRRSLADLLGALAGQTVAPGRIVVVDDRPTPVPLAGGRGLDVLVVGSGGQGPAAAATGAGGRRSRSGSPSSTTT